MTSLAIPPSGKSEQTRTELVVRDEALELRRVYATPPDVHLELGAWCPLDDTVLRCTKTLGGWACDTCWAAWDLQGQSGRWLAWRPVVELRPVSDEPVQPPKVAGSGVRAVGLFVAWSTAGYGVWTLGEKWRGTQVPDELIYILAALVGATALIRVAWAVIRRGR
ncbi:hypothetical protein [Polymorphospora sp. NPDC050346]|uniref:hypothetical protein n=1 Tax=Polymorphospora sp. NPDC050346 TaxID=3155780 RepID=UPI0033F428FD